MHNRTESACRCKQNFSADLHPRRRAPSRTVTNWQRDRQDPTPAASDDEPRKASSLREQDSLILKVFEVECRLALDCLLALASGAGHRRAPCAQLACLNQSDLHFYLSCVLRAAEVPKVDQEAHCTLQDWTSGSRALGLATDPPRSQNQRS